MTINRRAKRHLQGNSHQTHPCRQTRTSCSSRKPKLSKRELPSPTSRNWTCKQPKTVENLREFLLLFQRDFVLKKSCAFGVSVLHCVGHFFVALLQPAYIGVFARIFTFYNLLRHDASPHLIRIAKLTIMSHLTKDMP